MTLVQRGRMLSASSVLLSGGTGVIASTQPWLTVTRADAGDAIPVLGADAVPLLAPLSFALLALGAALTIVGPVMRYVFGALALACGAVLLTSTTPLLTSPPVTAVSRSVTEKTGLAGDTALTQIIGAITPTAWPAIVLVAWVVLAAGLVVLFLTARRWPGGGRRFRTEGAGEPVSGPVDPVDSWDDLSRGSDPTR